jgi:prolyl oligopeptidase
MHGYGSYGVTYDPGFDPTALAWLERGGVSAYHRLKDHNTAYPAVLLTTGINDPRVDPWQMNKMTARLQAATSSGKPVLLRVDYDAGHGGIGATRSQHTELLTDQFSFLLWQLGDPEFQTQATPVQKASKNKY